MKKRFLPYYVLFGLVLACSPLLAAGHKLQGHTVEAWKRYMGLTEARIGRELSIPAAFTRSDFEYLKRGGVWIQRMTTKDAGKDVAIKDGTFHHWLGAIFVPDVDLERLLRWVREYDKYAGRFKEVKKSELRSNSGDTFNIRLGLTRTKLGVTVHFDTDHTVVYGQNGPGRASSKSEATRIAQLDKYGTPGQREFPEGEDAGYLWRLNSYWRFSERDGGVVVECESVGLSRSLGSWLGFFNILSFGKIKGIAESVARESLQDTLTALRDGVRGVTVKK